MNKMFSFLILAVLVLFLAFKLYSIFSGTSTGEKAPEIEATLLNGKNFKLSDQENKYTLISFWGSWCAPCLKEAPQLVDIYKRYEGEKFSDGSSFDVLSIAIEKNDNRTKTLIEKLNLYWPKHIVETSAFVMKAPLALKYGITDLPTKILVGPEGNIINSKISLDELDQFLSEL